MAYNVMKKSSRSQQQDEFIPSETMLFIGNYGAKDPETGEQVFIRLPMPVYLENMKEGRQTDRRSAANNRLLQKLIQMGKEMKPGETREVNLKVQLYRKMDEIDIEEEDLGFDL